MLLASHNKADYYLSECSYLLLSTLSREWWNQWLPLGFLSINKGWKSTKYGYEYQRNGIQFARHKSILQTGLNPVLLFVALTLNKRLVCQSGHDKERKKERGRRWGSKLWLLKHFVSPSDLYVLLLGIF